MLIVDVGALIAFEQYDRAMWRRLKTAQQAGELPMTHGGIVAAVWRGKARTPVVLVRALASIDVVPLDAALGRAAGSLLATGQVGDVMAAALTLLARDGDQIVTSQPNIIATLAEVARLNVDVLPVGSSGP